MRNAQAVHAPMRDAASSRSNVIKENRRHRHSSHTEIRSTRPATCETSVRIVFIATV